MAGIENDFENCLVETMDDGGMGSIQFYSKEESRLFGKSVAEFYFSDSDGVHVYVSLYLDKEDNLLELDVWKVNYEPLLKYPKYEDLKIDIK